MRPFAVAILALVVVPAASARDPGAFSSTRYAYSLLLPLGWNAQPAGGNWAGALTPGSAGVDSFKELESGRVLTAAALPTALGRFAWHARVLRTAKVNCGGPKVAGTSLLRFGGANATLTAFRCVDGAYFTIVTVVHTRRGYAFGWLSHGPRAVSDWVELEGILDSVEFA
jgi:hypothetical protein